MTAQSGPTRPRRWPRPRGPSPHSRSQMSIGRVAAADGRSRHPRRQAHLHPESRPRTSEPVPGHGDRRDRSASCVPAADTGQGQAAVRTTRGSLGRGRRASPASEAHVAATTAGDVATPPERGQQVPGQRRLTAADRERGRRRDGRPAGSTTATDGAVVRGPADADGNSTRARSCPRTADTTWHRVSFSR